MRHSYAHRWIGPPYIWGPRAPGSMDPPMGPKGSFGRVQGDPRGSHGDPMGSILGILGYPRGIPGYHLRDPWVPTSGSLGSSQGALGVFDCIYHLCWAWTSILDRHDHSWDMTRFVLAPLLFVWVLLYWVVHLHSIYIYVYYYLFSSGS